MFEQSIRHYLEAREKAGFGTKDKIFLFRELAYLLQGGVSLLEAANTIAERGDNASQRYVGKQIAAMLKEWRQLSHALSRLPDYFNPSDVNIVKSGEASGNLVKVLASLSREYYFLRTLQGKYISALTYPILLLIISIIAVFVLFINILPGIFSIAEQFPGIEMPLVTRVMIEMSQFMQANIAMILIVLGVVCFTLSIIFSTESGKRRWFAQLLRMPLIGKMTKYYYLIKFFRYMRIMQYAGMSYMTTFFLLKDIIRIGVYEEMIDAMIAQLRRGETMHEVFRKYVDIVPTNASLLVKVGEDTANLPESLGNIIEIYEEDLNNMLNNLSKIIEPILIVFVGAIVVLIAFSVFGIITTILGGVQAN